MVRFRVWKKTYHSTEAINERIRNFRLMSMISFLGVGAWQIWYLRKYFQSKVRAFEITILI